MAEVKETSQELEMLIQKYPDMTKKQGVDYSLIQEAGAIWCKQVAKWIEKLLKHKIYGPKIQEMMNWYIRVLQPGKPARKAYDTLVNMLLHGYKLIRDRKTSNISIPGSIFDLDDPEPDSPAADFAERAISLIKVRFNDPWDGRKPDSLSPPYSATRDPIIISNIERLEKVMECLDFHQKTIGVPRIDRIRHLLHTEGDDEIELWLYAIEQLCDNIEPPTDIHPEPWIWLVVNVLVFSTPERYDVFELIPPRLQKSIGDVMSTNFKLAPGDYVQVIRNALELVRESFVESLYENISTTVSRPHKIENSKSEDTIQATPETDSKLIYLSEAAEFYNIPK